jgi:hypothetical protein
MPSPFPGMDPYIETPELWSDFHNDLASTRLGGVPRRRPLGPLCDPSGRRMRSEHGALAHVTRPIPWARGLLRQGR